MTSLFKILGLLLILIVSTAVGFLKAFSLKERLNNLIEIKKGLFLLKERLRLHSGNKERLLHQCIGKTDNCLKGDDLALWNEFLLSFGLGDTETEFKRCESYITLFEIKISDAEKAFNEQQKLYKCLGFLCGVFICIFLL